MRGVKVQVVSQLVAGGYSLAAIQAEVDKCEVVCQAHHRMRTMARRRALQEATGDGHS